VKYDRLRVEKLLSSLRSAQSQLERLAETDEDIFLSDPDKVASTKYNLIVAIEAVIDIGQHLIAKNKLPLAEDYANTFHVLSEAGVFSCDLLPNLINMAKFRNRLIHIYWNVNDTVIFEILQNHLHDFNTILQELSRVLR